MITHRLRLITMVAALCVLSRAATLNAQQCGDMSVKVPPDWHPRTVSPMGAMTAADRTWLQNTLMAMEQLVRKTAYGTPRGYEAGPFWNFDPPTSQATLSEYRFVLPMWCPSVTRTGGDGSQAVIADFNPYPQRWSEGDRPMLDGRGDRLYTLRLATPPLFGSTATFDGAYVLYTAGDESPTLPVSRAEYLEAMIFTVDGDTGAGSKSMYQQWVEQAAGRKKAREETIAIIAKQNAAQAEKTREALEKAERDQTEQMKKFDEQLAEKRLSNRYRTQLAAMTPAERDSPALIQGAELVAPNTPNAHPVVRENPAFYRARRSPTEPRAVLVRLPLPYRQLEALHRQVYSEFDWAAVKRLVNPAR